MDKDAAAVVGPRIVALERRACELYRGSDRAAFIQARRAFGRAIVKKGRKMSKKPQIETKRKVITLEPDPKELWLLLGTENGNWIRALDEPPDGECFLVCFSQAAARATAEHQANVWEIDCIPVKIWPQRKARR